MTASSQQKKRQHATTRPFILGHAGLVGEFAAKNKAVVKKSRAFATKKSKGGARRGNTACNQKLTSGSMQPQDHSSSWKTGSKNGGGSLKTYAETSYIGENDRVPPNENFGIPKGAERGAAAPLSAARVERRKKHPSACNHRATHHAGDHRGRHNWIRL